MVEDGHISNSYQYGSNTYYLDDIGRKNDSKNNNDSCVVVVDRRDDSTDEEASERCSLKTANSLSIAASGNCVSQPVKTSPMRQVNSPAVQISVRHEMYCPEVNGSSHIERTSSQHYFDVTKEAAGQSNDRNFPRELHKTFMAFGLLIFNFFLTTTSLAIIHDKVPRQYGPLPDTVLDLIDAWDEGLKISEILIILTTSIMLIIVVLHKHRFIIFRRLFLMLSLLYFMRSITMFVTVLPVSSETYGCSPQSNHTDLPEILYRSAKLFFGMGLTINGQHQYCGDYIYSGHTTILVMSYLMISEYSPKRMLWLHWVTWLMSFSGVLMVLLSHSHYTVDVILGYFITTRLFWMYHTCANNAALKKKSAHNYMSKEWWFFLFQYFECNVKGPLQPLGYS